MIFSSPIVLNEGQPSSLVSDQPIDIALTLVLAEMKGRFIDADRGVVCYKAIHASPEFEQYRRLTGGLRSFDLRSLQSRDQQLAFWINIYNTGVIHGVIELGLQASVKECRRFFERVSYEIGNFHFSLDEIEHGVLRGNQRPPYHLLRPFRKGDPRLTFIVQPMDPRVHFALVCGARSCPPISFYEASEIDFQLQLAAKSFINSPQVKILPEEKSIFISKIFKLYYSDFGGKKEPLIQTLLDFLDEG